MLRRAVGMPIRLRVSIVALLAEMVIDGGVGAGRESLEGRDGGRASSSPDATEGVGDELPEVCVRDGEVRP